MKKWLINSLIVMLAWTYIIPVEAMFLSPQAQKRSERLRRTTRTAPSSATSSLYEPELTESGAGQVGEKSPEPVGTSGPIEQPSMLSQGWQAAQRGSAAVQRKISAIVDEIRSWSYNRVLLTLLGIASALGVTILIKNAPNSFLDTIERSPELSSLIIGAGAWGIMFLPVMGWASDIGELKSASNAIDIALAGVPFKTQGERIPRHVQHIYNIPIMKRKLPAQQKLLSMAEAAFVKRMKDAMVAHAQVFSRDIQPQEVINFYNQNNLEDNGELAHQAYDEAIDALGFARADV